MRTENISTLKINKLTQEQYDRAVEAGNIDETALYFTPDDFDENELRDFITTEDEDVKNSVTSDFTLAIENAKSQLSSIINALDGEVDINTNSISGLNGDITSINSTISEIQTMIAEINSALEGKTDAEIILPWANYDEANETIEIGISSSPYYIRSTTSELKVYQGSTVITSWEGGQLKAVDITASNSISTPQVIVNGLVLKGDSTSGWSFI